MLTVELLRRSVKEWNEAREANRSIIPDLSGALLSGADLSRANFINANLSQAQLSGANLTDAYLGGANLSMANLRDANLSGASLSGVNLIEADLNGADLTGATIGSTIFGYVDLSSVKGLDTVRHIVPSTMGIDTLYLSSGNISEVFLKGCGVPDTFIDFVKSLTKKAFDYYSCFISYSHKDEDCAKRLWEGLQAKGVSCYYAPHDLPIGAKMRPAIDEAIRIHDKLLIILSEHSVQSNWVEHEVEHALDLETQRKKLVLFPIRIDNAVMDSTTGWAGNIRRQRNIGNFTQWKDHDTFTTAFERLLRDLQSENNTGETA